MYFHCLLLFGLHLFCYLHLFLLFEFVVHLVLLYHLMYLLLDLFVLLFVFLSIHFLLFGKLYMSFLLVLLIPNLSLLLLFHFQRLIIYSPNYLESLHELFFVSILSDDLRTTQLSTLPDELVEFKICSSMEFSLLCNGLGNPA